MARLQELVRHYFDKVCRHCDCLACGAGDEAHAHLGRHRRGAAGLACGIRESSSEVFKYLHVLSASTDKLGFF